MGSNDLVGTHTCFLLRPLDQRGVPVAGSSLSDSQWLVVLCDEPSGLVAHCYVSAQGIFVRLADGAVNRELFNRSEFVNAQWRCGERSK